MYGGTAERSDQSPPVVSVSARSPTLSGKAAHTMTERQKQKKLNDRICYIIMHKNYLLLYVVFTSNKIAEK